MKRKNTNLGTTASANFNEDTIIYDLMVNLLKKSYPVVKIKEKNRFKRGVVIDGKQFLVPKDNNVVFFSLFSTLQLLYGVEEAIIVKVLKDFYNL
jgi:hypothetical protein